METTIYKAMFRCIMQLTPGLGFEAPSTKGELTLPQKHDTWALFLVRGSPKLDFGVFLLVGLVSFGLFGFMFLLVWLRVQVHLCQGGKRKLKSQKHRRHGGPLSLVSGQKTQAQRGNP